MFRYVDDYVVFLESSPGEFGNDSSNVLDLFTRFLQPLAVTHEMPQNNALRFLDLRMFFERDQVCWSYEPRANKPLLPFSSGHSKLVKRGIAKLTLMNALRRSCPHKCSCSFQAQADRLKKAGFPQYVVTSVAEGLLKTVKHAREGEEQASPETEPVKQKCAVIPYLHDVSHRLKKIGNNANVRVVLSAPNKLYNLCKASYSGSEKPRCQKKHKESFVKCENNIVYELLLSCGKKYIGQTGRCANDRLREHANNVRTGGVGHLAFHCRKCGCDPMYSQCTATGRSQAQTTREIIEAAKIASLGDMCISAPSIDLSKKN